MSDLTGKTHGGFFDVDGHSILGELTIDGGDSLLYLRDEKFLRDHRIRHGCILGQLHDLTKVSLFGCLTVSSGHTSRGAERYNKAEIFPHYVLSGDRHLRQTDQAIQSITFVIDDAGSLFHDSRDFGAPERPEDHIAVVAKHEAYEVKLGEHPEIVYFSGRRDILRSETAIGAFTVRNIAHSNFGSENGIAIENRIVCQLLFPTPILFDTAIGRLLEVVRFCDLIVGRPQNVSGVSVEIADEPDISLRYLAVGWSMLETRKRRRRERSPHPIDVLIDGARSPGQFAAVLACWLERADSWRAPRTRFQETFAQQGSLTIDRIIADANNFDILPDDAFPPATPLAPEVEEAKIKARALFTALPKSGDRDSILSALGRLGRSSLRKKIVARATLIEQNIPGQFPELQLVIEEAVNCRNYFVHGSAQSFPYMKNWRSVGFFIDTLEFIFGATDLIDAGWSIDEWLSRGTTMSHPYGVYKVEYKRWLADLKKLLAESGA